MRGEGIPARAVTVALALALGTAVALGLARFSYALLLPPMRADLGWSYVVAGAMNTANAAGYLVGALVAPWIVRRGGAWPMLVAAMIGTGLALAGHGVVFRDPAVAAMRFAVGAVSAVAFVAGGVLTASWAAVGATEVAGRDRSGLVLGLYYGGTGLGVVASTLVVPPLAERAVPHAWQAAWWVLGVLGVVAALIVAWRVPRRPPTVVYAPAASGATLLPQTRRFHWRPFLPGLVSYTLFGLGYIGYITFVVAMLREHGVAPARIVLFYGLLGVATMVSPWLWARVLQRWKGGGPQSLFDGLLAVATLLPVLTDATPAIFASGLLFGGVMLSNVASTTALVRHNLPPSAWPAGIGAFTIVFAVGQIIGPTLTGYIAQHMGDLRAGLAASAAMLALASFIAFWQKPLEPAR